MLIEPALEQAFEVGEIDDAADVIDFFASDVEISDVVVAVKEFAFAAVAMQTVPGTKLDPSHDGKAHRQHSELNEG
jgi:hypothetical protein